MQYNNLNVSYITAGSSGRINRYITQENYENKMKEKVEPVLKKMRKSGYITGINNLKLYYEMYKVKNPKANIAICHGIGEYTEKYNELIYYFTLNGYSVFIMEHRGNGRSGRLGDDDKKISVEKFSYYAEDYKTFMDEVVIPNSEGKDNILFAHSMGGGIGTLFLEYYPEYFDAAVLSSPMQGIHNQNHSDLLAETVCRVIKLIKGPNQYMCSQKPYSDIKKFPNKTTSCEERYTYHYNKIISNPEFQTGGATVQWYMEASKAAAEMTKPENASKVKIPVMLLEAELDKHVNPKGHWKFCKYAENCRIYVVKGSWHESYFERDEIAGPVISKIFDFIENRNSASEKSKQSS